MMVRKLNPFTGKMQDFPDPVKRADKPHTVVKLSGAHEVVIYQSEMHEDPSYTLDDYPKRTGEAMPSQHTDCVWYTPVVDGEDVEVGAVDTRDGGGLVLDFDGPVQVIIYPDHVVVKSKVAK